MGWDASRPVPWTRLFKEYVIYAGIMVVVLFLFFRDNVAALLAGVVVALPIYLLLGYVLAKFGYQRTRLGEVRAARAAGATSSASTSHGAADIDDGRARPAPTRRTAGGANRRPAPPRKRRR